MILDDDHGGVFHFDQEDISFPESIGEAKIRVTRSSGARGRVTLPYKTVESTAKGGGQDFFDEDGELVFENDDIEWVSIYKLFLHINYSGKQARSHDSHEGPGPWGPQICVLYSPKIWQTPFLAAIILLRA